MPDPLPPEVTAWNAAIEAAAWIVDSFGWPDEWPGAIVKSVTRRDLKIADAIRALRKEPGDAAE